MNAIQRHIENARTACLDFVNSQFDELLTIVKANADFLAEMNATNATHDPDADYNVAYIATPAEIPNDAELEKAADQLSNYTDNGEEQPSKAGLVEEMKERLDLEQEGKLTPEKKSIVDVLFEQQNKPEWAVIDPESDLFKNICAWVISGEKDTANPVTDERLFFMQEQKKVRFTKKDFDHVQNLMWWRSELKKGREGNFSLKDILTQNSTYEWEKPLWEALAKTIK